MQIAFPDRLDPIALYAAIISTSVFGWQIYTWLRQGARLIGRTNTNMVTAGNGSIGQQRHLVINVTNIGNQPTTITHAAMYSFGNWFAWARGKPTRAFVLGQGIIHPLPYVLKVGELYMHMVTQTAEIEQLSRDTKLFVVVIHAFSERPLLLRIRPIAAEPANAVKPVG